jgi:hypothetical protein
MVSALDVMLPNTFLKIEMFVVAVERQTTTPEAAWFDLFTITTLSQILIPSPPTRLNHPAPVAVQAVVLACQQFWIDNLFAAVVDVRNEIQVKVPDSVTSTPLNVQSADDTLNMVTTSLIPL